MNRNITISLFIVIAGMLLLMVVAACGPAAPAAQVVAPAAANSETEPAEPDPPSQVAEATGPGRPALAAGSAEVDENGISIGFTTEGRAYRGDPNAPVVMEEFSDFQCPFCGRFKSETLTSLDEGQIAAGELVLVYHDFPLENIHPEARAAAHAARCAGDQGIGAYWDMHDLLYERVEEWSGSGAQEAFAGLAGELGLDDAAFTACMESNKHDEAIQADIDVALSRGVRSTPSFFLNGQSLIGAQPLAVFNQAIAMVLEGEDIVVAEEPEPIETSPLQPPRVAPTPAPVGAENAAWIIGEESAPVTIVEFTDYQCPFCQQYSQQTLPRMLEEMVETGRVRYILKDLPLDQIHPNARAAALAARCAGEQDAYLAMHDALFEAQETWAQSGADLNAQFLAMAEQLALETATFSVCLEEERYAGEIEANVAEALALGANSTPTFFIDGLPLPGAQPFELFNYAVGLAEEGLLADAYVPAQPDITDAYAIGDPDAPVTVIEYTDYQCPYCARHFEQTFGQIKEQFVDTGQVYYVFKDFPLTNIHPQAVAAAEAARCAGDQDAYLPMHDALFATQASWSGQEDAAELFITYAKDLGLDVETFTSCLQNNEHLMLVMQDLEEGTQVGVNGTPAFFINGHTMAGAQPFSVFEEAITGFLAQ